MKLPAEIWNRSGCSLLQRILGQFSPLSCVRFLLFRAPSFSISPFQCLVLIALRPLPPKSPLYSLLLLYIYIYNMMHGCSPIPPFIPYYIIIYIISNEALSPHIFTYSRLCLHSHNIIYINNIR